MRKLLILALLLAAVDCNPYQSHPLQSKQATSGDWTLPYGKWDFSFTAPYELPTEALYVRVIDTDGYLYTFNTLDSTSRDSEPVDKWTDVTFGGSVNFNRVKKPPQYIVFCWGSYIDQQTYETSAVFGPETWQKMKTPADHTRPSSAPVWYDRVVSGLSPGGKVKVWFSDVAERSSLLVTPLKLTARFGKDLTLCKDYVVPGGSFTFLRSTQAFINGKTYPYGNWNQDWFQGRGPRMRP